MAAKPLISRYGLDWPASFDDLQIERFMIRNGGIYVVNGVTHGHGLFHHYKAAQTLCWPDDDHHKWSDLILKSIIDEDIVVILGPGDAAKTYSIIRYALIDFWMFPDNTLFLISSTDIRGLELRIWGWMKTLFNRARELYPWLAGNVLESMHAITPAAIASNNQTGRVINKGLICIPCIQGGQYVGMGKFVGVKPPGKKGAEGRLRHVGDEVSFMKRAFLDAYTNWYGKPNFKGIMCGNPLDPMDCLGRAAEPMEGWTGMPVPIKTATWRGRFFNAFCVNLVGTDSPNFDFPQDEPVRYPYLVGKKKLDAVARTYGRDSLEWSSQCEGVMRPGLAGKRVITRELCRLHGAHDKAEWNGTARTFIYYIDPAYGGGDRCVGGILEFGEGVDNRPILKVHEPEVIPISVKLNTTPEDQIAAFVKSRLDEFNIPVGNCFYDSFGKGTVGFAFARVFGKDTPVPVDSGARPTKRPVRHDLFIEDNGERRLKRCDEHYSKFVTEMWFSVREIIEGDQMRELPVEVMEEGCMREYMTVMGNKYEVEPKEDTRERMGHSPDLFDGLAIGVEGARQRGFKIQRLGIPAVEQKSDDDWYDREAAQYDKDIKSCLLNHV